MRLRWLLPPLLLVAAMAAVVLAPARLAAWLLPADTLLADGLSGTLWSGHAARAVVVTPSGHFHLGALDWRLAPLSLLSLRPRVELETSWGDQRLQAQLQWLGGDRLRIRDGSFSAGAALLRQLAPLSVSGRIGGRVDELIIADGMPQALRGRLLWERAAWVAPGGSFSLGSYAVDFGPAGEQNIGGEVLTLAGPLRATGAVALDGRRYRLALDLGSERPLAAPLANALALMATPTAEGYRLRLDGQL
jgi:hypothetical protein